MEELSAISINKNIKLMETPENLWQVYLRVDATANDTAFVQMGSPHLTPEDAVKFINGRSGGPRYN
jgi:hypothetical protein